MSRSSATSVWIFSRRSVTSAGHGAPRRNGAAADTRRSGQERGPPMGSQGVHRSTRTRAPDRVGSGHGNHAVRFHSGLSLNADRVGTRGDPDARCDACLLDLGHGVELGGPGELLWCAIRPYATGGMTVIHTGGGGIEVAVSVGGSGSPCEVVAGGIPSEMLGRGREAHRALRAAVDVHDRGIGAG